MSVTLKDGSTIEDPRLDRLVQFDERSRNYSISDAVNTRHYRSISWSRSAPYTIDQGYEGACVGFSIVNRLFTYPFRVDLGSLSDANRYAVSLYWEAQRIDPWPGGAYPGASEFYEGTSVLAGLQVAHRTGLIDEYRWAFNMMDLVKGVAYDGPAILGLNWYESNYTPDKRGYIQPTGMMVGGHAILAKDVHVFYKDRSAERVWDNIDLDKSYFTLLNSWGKDWGVNNGEAYVTVRDMMTWMSRNGEAAFARKIR